MLDTDAFSPMHLKVLTLLPGSTSDPIPVTMAVDDTEYAMLMDELCEARLVERHAVHRDPEQEPHHYRRTLLGDIFNNTIKEMNKAFVRIGQKEGIRAGKLAAYTRAALLVTDHAKSYAVEAKDAKAKDKPRRAGRKLAAVDALIEGGLAISLCIVADTDDSLVDDAEISRAFARA